MLSIVARASSATRLEFFSKQVIRDFGVRFSQRRNYGDQGMNPEHLKKFSLPERFTGLDKNVWVEYIRLAKRYNPINLGQGFPDSLPPKHIMKALEVATQSQDHLLHQYTRSFGHQRLINAISNLYSPLVSREINPLTEVVVGIGATQVLFSIFSGHLQKGDEAIVIEPFFDCYKPMILLTGATPVYIALKPANGSTASTTKDWKLDEKELAGLFNEKTKLIVVNTPHNPFGKVFTKDELTVIADLCKKWNVLCISDEVYEWMVYKPSVHVRIASLPDMWERTITVCSAGKAFSVTGWKIGWAYGPAPLMQNLFVAHQNCVYTCATPLQEAIAVAMEHEIKVFGTPDSFFEQIKTELIPKRDFMHKALTNMGMKPIMPEGGYFMVADWTPLAPRIDLSQEIQEEKDYMFTKWMVKNIGVLAIPPSAFYIRKDKHLGEPYARFCFIKRDENLKKAAEKMLDWKASVT